MRLGVLRPRSYSEIALFLMPGVFAKSSWLQPRATRRRAMARPRSRSVAGVSALASLMAGTRFGRL